MWYRQSRWKPRLVAEQAVMAQRFPRFVLRRRISGELFWDGFIEPQPNALFRVTLTYPSEYPYREPALHVVDPPLRHGTPHVYIGASGWICVHRRQWNPATGTAASLVPLIAAWLVAYIHWLRTGESF
jgi:hypothetical protein